MSAHTDGPTKPMPSSRGNLLHSHCAGSFLRLSDTTLSQCSQNVGMFRNLGCDAMALMHGIAFHGPAQIMLEQFDVGGARRVHGDLAAHPQNVIVDGVGQLE